MEVENGSRMADRWRWSRQQVFTMVAMSSVNFSSMICYSILAPFFPSEARRKGVSQTIIGLIFGWYALCVLLVSLLLGKYIVQIGAKFMIISGIFVSAVCTMLFGLLDRTSSGMPFILLCFLVRSVNAVGFAAAVTSSFAILAKVFPNNIATVMGCVEVFTGLGLILGPPLGGWLYQSFGFEIPFIALGCLLFAMVPFNICLLPKLDADESESSFLRLCSCVRILLICFALFTLSSGLGFLDATLALFAVDKFSMSSGSVGLLMMGLSLPYGAASPVFGFFSDKFPHLRRWMMVTGGMITAMGFCLLGPVPVLHVTSHLWLTVLMLVLIGFSLCLTGIPSFAEMLVSAHELGLPENLSTLGLVSGLFSAVWSAGMFFGPVVGGYVAQQVNFQSASGVQGGITFIAALLLGVFYIYEEFQKKRSLQCKGNGSPADPDATTPLLNSTNPS
ncbi:MFS-type transporter SLC18B1 isoform X2 [Denticeps clupeoides]|uniref:MFS-type transporter SLC18B1 isoform X2 n=1 Tax=Denticeps clupeoides TaxID=299321 RepID=UPI0010A2FD33|nr:MFS-type transporter SLC18B1 isoform X2 [Denticeps clupeoides]